MSGVVLGRRYEDSHTNFKGLATARTEYLYGCVRVCLEASTLKENGELNEAWFDEQRLIDPETRNKVLSSAEIGGPREAAPRRPDKG